MAAERRARSSCRLERSLTPRKRRASFPASRLGSGMGGERLSPDKCVVAITAATLPTARNRARQPEFQRHSVALAESAAYAATPNARRRDAAAAATEEPVDRNRPPQRRRRGRRVLAAKMQPLLDVLGAAGRLRRASRQTGSPAPRRRRLLSEPAAPPRPRRALTPRLRRASCPRRPRRLSPPRTLASRGRQERSLAARSPAPPGRLRPCSR